MVVRDMADVLKKSIFQNWNLRRMVSTQKFFLYLGIKTKDNKFFNNSL